MRQTVHVYRSEKGWTVEREGGSVSVFSTQREAITRARSIARNTAPSQIVVHGRDGAIRDYRTYGLPKVQDPPGKSAVAKQIEKAIGKVVFERLAASRRSRG